MSMFDTWLQHSGTPSLLETFGETVTFIPGDGSSQRQLTAIFSGRTTQDERDVTQDNVDEYEVEFNTDPSNATYGGIKQLFPQDKVVRQTANDPDDRPYVFTGEIIARSKAKLRGVFSRTKRIAQGRSR